MDNKFKNSELYNKELLKIEVWLFLPATFISVIVCFIVSYCGLPESISAILVLLLVLFILCVAFIALRIEQIVGYYECDNCHHKYIPKYTQVLWACHFFRTRYMKCPKCNKRSWSKKVLTK